jgi:hypothetical protein
MTMALTAAMFRPTPPRRDRTGYTDKARHKYWHFVDKPFSDDGTPTQPEKDPNAQTQIPIMRTALGSVSDSDAAKDLASYDLVWLEHLVGDAHQPLHATTRFTQDLPDGDAGGNSVKVHCGTDHGCGASELHALWDDLLGPNTATPDEVEAAANALPDADAAAAAIADEGTWIDESFQAAQSVVYQAPIGEGVGPFPLTAEYGATDKALAKQRIALAGARLANMLNDALKQRTASRDR